MPRAVLPPSQSVARADWNQPLGTSYTAQYSGDSAPEPAPRYAGDSYPASPSAPASPLIPQDYGSQNYERQPYETQPLAGGTDHYEPEQGSRQFPLGQSEYQQDFYNEAPVEDEYYEDAPPSRRRMVVMAVAGVVALAVIGTAGAFGYRALVGSSGSTKPPPVIKADTAPSKIVPATTGKDAQSNKLITDRVNERGQSEKLVSREEQPMDRPAAVALSQSGPQMALGSGVVGSEPKKVRTIAIHPDQPMADAAPSSMSAAAAPAKPAPAPRVPPPPLRHVPRRTRPQRRKRVRRLRHGQLSHHVRRRLHRAARPCRLIRMRHRRGRHRRRPPQLRPGRPRYHHRRLRRHRPAGRAATSRFPRSAARVRLRRRSAAFRPSSRTSLAVGSPLFTRPTWAPRAPITAPWLDPLPMPARQISCARASRQPAGSASSRGINRTKLDPCDVRGLIRADGGARIYHGIGGTYLIPQ